MSDQKQFEEIDLDAEDPRATDFGSLHTLSFDEDCFDPDAGVVRQHETRTIDGNDQLNAAVRKVVTREVDQALWDGREPNTEQVVARFPDRRLKDQIRERLPSPENMAEYDPAKHVDAITAAIALAYTEREIELQPRPGRKRQGKQAKEVISIRMEPRHQKILSNFGLDVKNVAEGLTDLIDRFQSDECVADLLINVLGPLFYEAGRTRPVAARFEPHNKDKWLEYCLPT